MDVPARSVARPYRRLSAAALAAMAFAAASCRKPEPPPPPEPALPAPVRLYAFDGYGPAATNVSDRAGSTAALAFQPVKAKEFAPDTRKGV